MNAWRMLDPEVHLAPKSTKHHGRAQVVIGGSVRDAQMLFLLRFLRWGRWVDSQAGGGEAAVGQVGSELDPA
ncbi:hypothetical protein ACIA8I_41305, partial [Streptomyces rishiriensis]|uniref:hypothetical protein n=1 Tax=Streptomyces rishiriensis TaxID=68264 RepID=UPI00378BD071